MLDSTTKSGAEVAGDGLRLGGGLDDHERRSACAHTLAPTRQKTQARGRRDDTSRHGRYRLGTCRRPLYYFVAGALSWPVMHGVFRLHATGVENVPGGRSRPGRQPHARTSTPGRSGFRSGPGGSSTSWPSPSCSTRCSGRSSRRGRVPGAARRARHAGDRDGGRALPRGRRSSPCSPRAHGGRRGCGRSSRRGRAPAAARIALAAGVPLVPAAIKGTDRLLSLARLQVAYGAADPGSTTSTGMPPKDAAETATERLRPRSRRCTRSSVSGRCSRSTATRSRTAPTTRCRRRSRAPAAGPAGAIVGFANMLLRLWEAERPRAVLVGWDTLEVPTYRHEASRATSAGASSTRRCSSSSRCCPSSSAPAASRSQRRRATRPTTSSPRRPARGGARRNGAVATSDRDAFQLASERTTILQPVRGVSELARIGPAEVRERYGVDPAQVPDFIALRGDPSDGCRARAASARRRPPTCSASTARWRRRSPPDDLRRRRRNSGSTVE